MCYVISIDPSIHSTGVTIFKDSSPICYEFITPQSLDNIERLHYNYMSFCKIFNSYNPIKCISYECQIPQMRYNANASSILTLAENIGILKLAISSVLTINPKLIVLGIPPADIKKFATNNSKATKEDMISAVDGRHIKSIRNIIPERSVNDIADSYHLGRYTLRLLCDDSYKKYLI